MARVRGPGGGRLRNGSGARYRCADCPCDTAVDACDLCGSLVPSTFNVQIDEITDVSCSSCVSTMEGTYAVTYQGTTSCFGDTYHYWTSAADIFGSPGSCSGILDNKMLFILIRKLSGSSCQFIAKLMDDDLSPCASVTLDSGVFAMSGENNIFSGDPCTDTVGIISDSANGTGQCSRNFANNFILFV